VLHLAGLVEEWGTGTLRVVSSMQGQGNPEPTFQEILGGISVVLPLLGAAHALLSDRQQGLLNALRNAQRPARAADLAAAVDVSLRTAQNDLSALEALGLVVREGRGRALRWRTVG